MDAERVESRRRLLLAGVLIGLPAVATASMVLPVLRGPLQAHYGLSNAMFGFLLSFGSLAGAAGALASGPLVDRLGPWFMFRLSTAGAAAGYAWGAVADSLWPMVAALAVVYFFYYAMAISAPAALVALYPRDRRRVITAYLIGASLMGILLPLIGEAQLKVVASGRLSFGAVLAALFALASGLLLAGLFWVRRLGKGLETAPGAGKGAGAGGGPAMGGLWLLVAFAALHCIHDNTAVVWLPKILVGPSYASHAILPGTVLALFSLGYLLSRLGLGLMPERKWRRRLLVAPGLAGGLVLLAGLLTRTQAGAAVGYVLGGLCWSLEYPVAVAAMSGDRRFGLAMGVMNVVSGGLSFAVPTALGGVMDRLQATGRAEWTWLVLAAPAAGFFLNGILGWWWVRRHGRQFD